MKQFLILVWVSVLLIGCQASDVARREVAKCFDTSSLSPEERELADSLLAIGLDNEALYTLFAPLKPISTVVQFSLNVARPDSLPAGIRNATSPDKPEFELLRKYQRIVNALCSERVELFLIPFRRADKSKRFFEIVAVDKRLLSDIIRRDQAFWGQWGFVAESHPATVLTATEFEEKLDRYRAYGYLFGYPEHAITFFVEAARTQDCTGVFVQRDFFQIPVYSAKTGRFVYAVPKGYVPTGTDSLIYREAEKILAQYTLLRARHLDSRGRLRAIDLLRERCSP